MNIYLVQRGKFKTIDFSAIEGIDSLIQFDYMGSAEFEFGAKGKSLERIMPLFKKTAFRPYTIVINNARFSLFSKTLLDNGKEIEDFMKLAFEKKDIHTKELVNIDRYFEGEYITQLKRGCISKTEKVTNYGYCNFWWDIENDWMLVPQSHSYPEKLVRALSELEQRGW